MRTHYGEQGWRSGESARLSPMWPEFDSRIRRLMWVEFVVSSYPCSEGFFLRVRRVRFFLPPQKLTFLNYNSTWNLRATGLSVTHDSLLSVTLAKQRRFICIYFICYENTPIKFAFKVRSAIKGQMNQNFYFILSVQYWCNVLNKD